jgi:hypothetical protein
MSDIILNKQGFMDEFCRQVNIQEAIDQFGGPALDEAEMTFDEWVIETTEDNETAASLCYGI